MESRTDLVEIVKQGWFVVDRFYEGEVGSVRVKRKGRDDPAVVEFLILKLLM